MLRRATSPPSSRWRRTRCSWHARALESRRFTPPCRVGHGLPHVCGMCIARLCNGWGCSTRVAERGPMQILGMCRPMLAAQLGPTPTWGRNRSNSAQIVDRFDHVTGRVGPESARFRPTSTDIWVGPISTKLCAGDLPNLAKLGSRPTSNDTFAQHRPTCPGIEQLMPDIGQHRSDFGQIWPESANIDARNRPDLARDRPSVARFRSLARARPCSPNMGPTSVKFGTVSTTFGMTRKQLNEARLQPTLARFWSNLGHVAMVILERLLSKVVYNLSLSTLVRLLSAVSSETAGMAEKNVTRRLPTSFSPLVLDSSSRARLNLGPIRPNVWRRRPPNCPQFVRNGGNAGRPCIGHVCACFGRHPLSLA